MARVSRRRFVGGLVSLAGLPLVSGCRGGSEQPATPAGGTATGAAGSGGTLRIIWAKWDPASYLQLLSDGFKKETGIEVALDGLLLVDARRARDTSFIFAGRVTGGELEPQLGEIAEVGWLDREEIGRTSPGLHRLLSDLDMDARYLGLH